MKTSTNIGLNIPEGSDVFNYKTFLADNFQKLDTILGIDQGGDSRFDQIESSLADIATYVIDIDAGFFTDPQSLLSDIDGGLFINE